MKKFTVPDAWEDDWETQADRAAIEDEDETEHGGGASLQPAPSLTKAERITKHEEANRKMWESADSTPQTFHYVEASSTVPLTTSFKPQVKVLSRKPVIAKRDPVTGGMSQLSLQDDDDAENKKEPPRTAEEIRAKQKRDLEERQRRYDEARAKIFGESNPSSRGSSPGTVTPPRSDCRHSGNRGRGRGGGRGNSTNNHDGRGQLDMRRANNQHTAGRELYDPYFSPKPDSMAQQRRGGEGDGSMRASLVAHDQYQCQSHYQPPSLPPQKQQQQQLQQQAIRSPRGPDGSGRGGFGFARRGNGGS